MGVCVLKLRKYCCMDWYHILPPPPLPTVAFKAFRACGRENPMEATCATAISSTISGVGAVCPGKTRGVLKSTPVAREN